jgi:nucleoside-diphosphate-sugar epimerase
MRRIRCRMKVLLTGASGFVGSHILDSLRARNLPTVVLLRATSDRRFLGNHLHGLEVRTGSIDDLDSLNQALTGITQVIHCAGRTKALRSSEFFEANQTGTQKVVSAVNEHRGEVRRLIHLSSLAASGPTTDARPASEEDPPRPVSTYGRSKLAGELEVRNKCQVDYTIIRPPAVYGPRDEGFLSMFRAVKSHLLPRPSERQALSLVYVKDLANAIVTCLDHPKAAGKVYFVAPREIVTARRMAKEIARQMRHWTIPCPLPAVILWPVCLFEQLRGWVTGKASLLNLQKFAELRAPGWVCDPSRLEREIGFKCGTTLERGVAESLAWYAQERWL